jgi:hypothetical protein
MKKIAISQPRYLPSCNYIERIIISDIFVIMDNVQHQKRAYEHRNKIRTSNGSSWLSIPIDRKNSKSDKICDLLLLNGNSWKETHLKSFEYNYRKTPFYNEIISLLRFFYSKERYMLNEVVKDMLDILIDYLELDVNIVWASEYKWNLQHDDLLIEMVKYFDGDTYISGPNGRNYIEKNKFKDNGIELIFHEYDHPHYDQIWGDFIPYMTIFDLLFYKGKESKKIIESGRMEVE